MHNEQLRDFLETLACVGDEYPSTSRSSSGCHFPGLVTRNAVLILSVIISYTATWSAVLFDKLIVTQLFTKFPAFYGN